MEFFAARAPVWLAGTLLGSLVVVLLWAANQPFGATGGFIAVAHKLRRPSEALGWRGWMFVGIFLGGLTHALLAGGLHPSFTTAAIDAKLRLAGQIVFFGGAGTLIGWGVRTARGCTSGHGICGVAMGSPMSVVATVTFMGTAVGVAHLVAVIAP